MTEVILYTGLSSNVISINPETNLSDVRKQITPSIIAEDESEGKGKIWRFIGKLDDVTTFNTTLFDDMVLARGVESKMNATMFIDGGHTLSMIDVNQRPPSLIGVKCDKFLEGDVECEIWKNGKLSSDKFNPVMLNHVKDLTNSQKTYKNVFVCQEKTPVVIRVNAKGHSAFGYSIMSDTGDVMVDSLYAISSNTNVDASAVLRQYPGQSKLIAAEAVEKDEKQKQYRIIIHLWSVSCVTDVNRVTVDYTKKQTGEPTSNNISLGEITSVQDNRNDVIGVVEIDVFAFQSIGDAEKIHVM